MQGTQSSIIPDMTETRSLASRQRVNEAVLTAMDEEEARHGRPAWLRHWMGEEQRPVAFEGEANASSEIRQDEAGASKTAVDAVNVYSGQSIEAAFTYETAFHFDTELEAESTEDWLDLSPGSSGGDIDQTSLRSTGEVEEFLLKTEVRHSGSNGSDGSDLHGVISMEQTTTGQADVDLTGRTVETLAAAGVRPSTTSIDPKAVRAAIFRLAQESSKAFKPEVLANSGAGETGPLSEPPSLTSQGDFAEVARRVWTAEDGSVIETETSSRVQGGLPETSEQPEPAGTVSFLPEVEPREAREPEFLHIPMPDATASLSDATGRDAYSAAAQEPVSSVPAQPERPLAAEGGILAGGAPALAHDAGNLLSALKLYSELLALSGVLQARHSHYAEDLKLLAARSEVLIDRLLQSFSRAEDEARDSKAQQLSSEAVVPGTHQGTQGTVPHPSDAPLVETAGHAEQSSALTALASATDLPETGRSGSEEPEPAQDRVRYWTDERLSAIHDQAGEGQGEGTKAFAKPALKTDTGSAWTVADASPHRDDGVPQSRPETGGAMRLEQSARVAPVEVGPNEGSSKPINLIELLTRWGGLLSMIARGPVQVNFGPHASLPIQVGEEALERILVNLVHNAMEATLEGGSIRIGVGRAETRGPALLGKASGDARPPSRMVLTVDDSGCGMTEQQVARALGIDANAALRRVSKETHPVATAPAPRPRGHGMGLQIVRELVAASGGELAIYSRRGAGTRIEIQWPVLTQRIEDGGLPQRILPASIANLSLHSNSQGSIHAPRKNLAQGNLAQGDMEGAIAC
jgi:Histidine kinase-, DNA gyrase B-, and HSP90-like ATPase